MLVVLTSNEISDSKAELASLEARKAQADLTAHDLAPYANFAEPRAGPHGRPSARLAQSRFDWERVLNELALVIPPNVTLENLTGTASAGAASARRSSTTRTSDASITGPSLRDPGLRRGPGGHRRLPRGAQGHRRRHPRRHAELAAARGGRPAPPRRGDSAATATDSDSCQTKPSIATFEITVAFDAVPVPPTAAAPSTGTPAAAPAPGTTTPPTTTTAAPTTTTATTTTDASGAAATQSEQQSAVDSAKQQVSDAKERGRDRGGGRRMKSSDRAILIGVGAARRSPSGSTS